MYGVTYPNLVSATTHNIPATGRSYRTNHLRSNISRARDMVLLIINCIVLNYMIYLRNA